MCFSRIFTLHSMLKTQPAFYDAMLWMHVGVIKSLLTLSLQIIVKTSQKNQKCLILAAFEILSCSLKICPNFLSQRITQIILFSLK